MSKVSKIPVPAMKAGSLYFSQATAAKTKPLSPNIPSIKYAAAPDVDSEWESKS